MKELHIRNPFIPLSLSEFCLMYGLTEPAALQEIANGELAADTVDGCYSISYQGHCDWARRHRPDPRHWGPEEEWAASINAASTASSEPFTTSERNGAVDQQKE